jgi:hypothetical protein
MANPFFETKCCHDTIIVAKALRELLITDFEKTNPVKYKQNREKYKEPMSQI